MNLAHENGTHTLLDDFLLGVIPGAAACTLGLLVAFFDKDILEARRLAWGLGEKPTLKAMLSRRGSFCCVSKMNKISLTLVLGGFTLNCQPESLILINGIMPKL